MALQMNRVKNRADEAIARMDASSSTSAYVNELRNMDQKENIPVQNVVADAASAESVNVTNVTESIEVNSVPNHSEPSAENVIEREGHLPIIKNNFKKENKVQPGQKRRGRIPKAEYGEECRVQFSTTLPPEMYKQLRAECKEIGAPLSYLVERILREHFKSRVEF